MLVLFVRFCIRFRASRCLSRCVLLVMNWVPEVLVDDMNCVNFRASEGRLVAMVESKKPKDSSQEHLRKY